MPPGGHPEIDEMLAVIEDAATQASEFASELAGFSANRKGVQRALNVNRVIAEAVSRHWKSGTTRIRLSCTDAPLICDIFQNPFNQIVRNIVINSIQALDGQADGLVVISTEKISNGRDFAQVRFEDNGPGIPSANYDRIFEPEFTTKPKGNGIGLWLARIQLEAVGGTIEIDREMKKGAAFVVRIPLSTNPASLDEVSDASPDR